MNMKLTTFDMMRVWAALTGIVLAALYFARVYDGMPASDMLPMLIAAIGGFELFLLGHDRAKRNPSGGPHG